MNLDKTSCSRRTMLAATTAALASRLAALPLAEIKLGITTDEIDEDVAVAAKFIRDFGLHWAEIRNIWGKYNTVQPVEKVQEARAILDKNDIRVSVEGTGFFKIPLPSDQRILDEQWKLLDAAIERAKLFGTQTMRIFAFTYGQGETPSSSAYPRIYELIREASRKVKPTGIRLGIENVGGSYVSTGAQAAELLKHVKEDNVGITWDPNNAGASGEQSFPEGFKKLDPKRIFHVHLRDYKHQPDGKVVWTWVGDGEFDNLSQIRALRKAGYNGTYTLETHWKSPKGKADATEVSLKGLLKVIEKV